MGWELGVKRLLTVILSLAIALAFALPVVAQGLPTIEVPGLFDVAGARIVPEIRIGCQHLALNFNLPATQLFTPFPSEPTTLDLKFRDANLWVGSAALKVDFPSGVSVAVKGQANAKKNIEIYEGQEWLLNGREGVRWIGSQLEWWALEGQAAYRLATDCSILIGLRRDHVSVNLRDPRDSSGNPLNLTQHGAIPAPFPTTIRSDERYYSDLVSKLWIPYLGVELRGRGYKASLIGSPFVWAQMDIPLAYLLDFSLTIQFPFGSPITNQLLFAESVRYRVNKPAAFLEGSFQYDLYDASGLRVGLWTTGSWLRLRGQGNWNYDFWGQVIAAGAPFPPSTESQSEENVATYARYLVSGGFWLKWFF